MSAAPAGPEGPTPIVLTGEAAQTARRRAAAAGMTPEEYLGQLVEQDEGADDPDFTLTDEERREIGDLLIQRIEDPRPRIRVDAAFWADMDREIEEAILARDRARAGGADAP